MTIKVVLTQNVPGVGSKGEILPVSRGYARNFLIPCRLARMADEKDVAEASAKRAAMEKRRDEELAGLKDVKQRLFKKRITILIPANEHGTLYRGAIAKDITDALYTTYGLDIPSSFIQMETIKTVGLHSFKVALKDHGEVPMKARVKPLT